MVTNVLLPVGSSAFGAPSSTGGVVVVAGSSKIARRRHGPTSLPPLDSVSTLLAGSVDDDMIDAQDSASGCDALCVRTFVQASHLPLTKTYAALSDVTCLWGL